MPSSNQHTMIPVDRIITSSIDNNNNNNDSKIISMGPITTTTTDRNKNGLRRYLNINTNTASNDHQSLSRSLSDSELKKKNKKLSPLNSFLAHNAKFQNLHIILILLLMFCVFLIISLCSPDMIGIDNSFQKVYYPQSHNDNFIFVYDILINKKSKLRDHIKYTPKSQRINPYILHDHFNPNDDPSHDSHQEDTNNILIESEDEDESIIQEFSVRIHHLRRGFYFDTSFNDMDNEQVIKFKNMMMMEEKDINDIDAADIVNDLKLNKLNKSYTGLGVQFDEEYDVTVNGLLLRIDEGSLTEFGKTAGKALKLYKVPLEWIDFLYTKPKEFTNVQILCEDKIESILCYYYKLPNILHLKYVLN